MNGSLLTSLLILVCSFASCERAAYGQPNGYLEIEHRNISQETPKGCWPDTGLYDSAKLAAAKVKQNCEYLLADSNVDAQSRSLVYYTARSDCHMRVVIKVFRVDAEKKYKLIINNIYGGCRASGSRSGWVEFEKLMSGYDFEMIEVGVDRIHDTVPEGFVFPRPPSIWVREDLPIREISINDCLELPGQSQWIIQSEETILRALEYKPNQKECAAAVKTFDVNFGTEILVGYSFASGHCGRPPGLKFSLTKETSSYAKENRLLVEANYEKAETDSCKVWTTYPTWLVIPKASLDYRFDFVADAN